MSISREAFDVENAEPPSRPQPSGPPPALFIVAGVLVLGVCYIFGSQLASTSPYQGPPAGGGPKLQGEIENKTKEQQIVAEDNATDSQEPDHTSHNDTPAKNQTGQQDLHPASHQARRNSTVPTFPHEHIPAHANKTDAQHENFTVGVDAAKPDVTTSSPSSEDDPERSQLHGRQQHNASVVVDEAQQNSTPVNYSNVAAHEGSTNKEFEHANATEDGNRSMPKNDFGIVTS